MSSCWPNCHRHQHFPFRIVFVLWVQHNEMIKALYSRSCVCLYTWGGFYLALLRSVIFITFQKCWNTGYLMNITLILYRSHRSLTGVNYECNSMNLTYKFVISSISINNEAINERNFSSSYRVQWCGKVFHYRFITILLALGITTQDFTILHTSWPGPWQNPRQIRTNKTPMMAWCQIWPCYKGKRCAVSLSRRQDRCTGRLGGCTGRGIDVVVASVRIIRKGRIIYRHGYWSLSFGSLWHRGQRNGYGL